MSRALGLVETKGLIGAIEAADAMAKAANVTIIGRETVKPAMVTIKIVGETAAVKHAVEAGAYAAKAVGQLISVLVIPQPDDQIYNIMPELVENPSEEPAPIPKPPKEKIPKKIAVDIPKEVPLAVKETAPEISEVIPDTKAEEVIREIIPKPVKEKTPRKKGAKKPAPAENLQPLFEDILTEPEKNYISPETEQPITEIYVEPEQDVVYYEEEYVKEIEPEVEELQVTEEISADEPEEKTDLTELDSLNVHQLRRMARSVKDFPIQGREISKANRTLLLEYLKKFR
ncbi:MAG: BMC domain-containing protein [Ignavibacteriaceae bacterium]